AALVLGCDGDREGRPRTGGNGAPRREHGASSSRASDTGFGYSRALPRAAISACLTLTAHAPSPARASALARAPGERVEHRLHIAFREPGREGCLELASGENLTFESGRTRSQL